MRDAAFHTLDDDNTVDGLSAIEQLVCEIAVERWRTDKCMPIACEDEKQAFRLDEIPWARPAKSFVPYNLAGKDPRGGAPTGITWLRKRNSNPCDLLISLRVGFVDLATAFVEVIDFVPYEDSSRQSARDRCKTYRVAGFNLNTATRK